jgi:lysozyme family protein
MYRSVSEAILATVQNEGGWGCDPDDPGGETTMGITRPNFPKWEGWAIVDGYKSKLGIVNNKATPAQIKTLNEMLYANQEYMESVVHFYKSNFWDAVKGDSFTSLDVAHCIFDFAVNTGVSAAVKVAQVAARLTGSQVDGKMGMGTLTAIEKCGIDLFIARFTLGKISRYVSICENRPVSKKYFYGWVSRAIRES